MAIKGGFTAVSIKSKPDGKHADATCPNLYLWVRNGGRHRAWQFRYSKAGKANTISLGSLASVSLVEARAKVTAMRAMINQGIDPKSPQEGPEAPESAVITFRDDAMSYYQFKLNEWVPNHARQWLAAFENHIFSRIGDRETSTLKSADLVAVLEPLWESHYRTAFKLHLWIKAIMARAIGLDDEDRPRFTRPNPALRVIHTLGMRDPKPVRHPSICWRDAPALYKRLADHDSQAAKALMLTMMTAARAGEIIGLQWREVDLDAGVLHIPADRMKSGVGRDIPLAKVAVDLLNGLTSDRSGYCFTGRRGKVVGGTTHGRKRERIGGTFVPFSGAIHRDAMQNLLRNELGLECHVHGMRATFRTFISDTAQSVRDHDAAEIALDHVIGTKVARAYDRADLMCERRQLAERWASHLTGGRSGQEPRLRQAMPPFSVSNG
jgi:integrase